MSPNLFKKTLFEQISVCCWPRIVVKIDPKRSLFTFGPPPSGQNDVEGCLWASPGLLLGCSWLLLGCSWLAPGLLLAPPGLLLTHTSIRTSHLEGSRAGRCILRRRDSRCVVSERHRAGVLGLGSPMHGELARPASPHEVGEGALTAVCPPAGPNLPPAE